MSALKIPVQLLEEAGQVPGLRERVARFIRVEVAQHEMRLKRFRPETLALVARAERSSKEKRAKGFELDVEKAAFLQFFYEEFATCKPTEFLKALRK